MWEIAAYVTAALIVGTSKTSVSGFGVIAVMLFALVMPAKESTAAVLLLLILGDIVAVWRYRRDCDWGLLVRLLPYVVPGIALGALFMRFVDDDTMRRSIGLIIGVFVVMQIVQRFRATRSAKMPRPRRDDLLAAAGYGTMAGFTTMTANAAGPVLTLYLLAVGVDKRTFIGTNAWYFLIVNLTKVPFSAALGLFPESTLWLVLYLAPAVLFGTWVGTRITNRISQAVFERLAILASLIAAVVLLVR